MTVEEIGERALIERIRERVPPAPPFVIVGIGDDAAVVEPERNAFEVFTTDSQVEGVHFDQTIVSAADIGHKALAVNLSDLAAMGAAPRVALLSLVLPPGLLVTAVDALVDGMTTLAARSRISLVGGNIARSPGPLVVDVTVVGSVHRRRILARAGARAGDDLYVTGSIGGAALGLRLLQQNRSAVGSAVDKYRRPEPRTRFGMLLGRNRAARACIDLSDGLADGIQQLAAASGLGAIVEPEAIPIEPGATLADALSGGEDYELLFASARSLRSRLRSVQRLTKDVAVTRIGRLTADTTIGLMRGSVVEPLPSGFVHF